MMKTKMQPTLLVAAIAVAFGSLVLTPTASAEACAPRGVGYTGNCDGNAGPSPSYLGPMIIGNQTSIGSVDGIPCTIMNEHRCRAHLQLGGTYVP